MTKIFPIAFPTELLPRIDNFTFMLIVHLQKAGIAFHRLYSLFYIFQVDKSFLCALAKYKNRRDDALRNQGAEEETIMDNGEEKQVSKIKMGVPS